MKINITKYWERLWAEDLFAAIILEEDFDLDENGAPRVDCTNWEQDFRAELNGYITAPKCCEERREDYRKALTILDEMEQAAAEQSNATAAPDYTALAYTIRAELNARHDRSAWNKAEIIDMMHVHGAPEMVQGTAKAIYKDVQSVRLDSKLLQAAHPDIYAECSKRTTYKRFSVV